MTLCVERMEHKWGSGRLRLLVGPELRDKFDRQRYLTNQAVFHGGLEDLKQQCQRMVKGWNALDRAADALGLERCPPEAWDIVGASGTVHVIVRTRDDAKDYRMGRERVSIYSLEEIAVILDALSPLEAFKEAFEGAEVISLRKSVGDALDDVADTQSALDDDILF